MKNLFVSILHLTKLLSRFVSDATHLLYQLFTHQKPQELTYLDPLEQKYLVLFMFTLNTCMLSSFCKE